MEGNLVVITVPAMIPGAALSRAASISGTVKDASGAVRRVSPSRRQPGLMRRRERRHRRYRQFRITELLPGSYTVTLRSRDSAR
jgi:hypothetical protein